MLQVQLPRIDEVKQNFVSQCKTWQARFRRCKVCNVVSCVLPDSCDLGRASRRMHMDASDRVHEVPTTGVEEVVQQQEQLATKTQELDEQLREAALKIRTAAVQLQAVQREQVEVTSQQDALQKRLGDVETLARTQPDWNEITGTSHKVQYCRRVLHAIPDAGLEHDLEAITKRMETVPSRDVTQPPHR